MSDAPEADRLDETPHPRETARLVGHRAAREALTAALRTGRMHHAWLIGGPEGIGKATLAWAFAKRLLSHAPGTDSDADLVSDPAHPAVRRLLAQAHPNILSLRRTWNGERKTFYQDIRVEEARKLASFFGSTAGEDGWRIAIVDSADDLNPSSANALLKMLEEPPARAMFLIVSHQPGRLLPTIRSRCRRIMLEPLSSDDMLTAAMAARPDIAVAALHEAAAIADGSVRRAITLAEGGGAAVRQKVETLLGALPTLDIAGLHGFADMLTGKKGEDAYALFEESLAAWLHARATSPGLPLTVRARFAEIATEAREAGRTAEVFNLDRKAHILKVFRNIADAWR